MSATTDFGTDVAGFDDVDPGGQMATGRPLLAQEIVKRYTCPRGRLIDDPNYGEDLTEHVNDDMSALDIAAMQSAAEQEALKDERVVGCSVAATLQADGTLVLSIALTDADGPFQFVLSVSTVTVTLLTVTP